MDDKIFNLMEKMYSDLTSRMDSMNSSLNSRMDSMEENMATKQDINGVKQQIVRLEDKMDINHKVLHDGYKQTYEKLTSVEDKLDKHEEILKGHDLKIKVMRNAK